MKNKLLLLFAVVLIAVLFTPTPALAYSGVTGTVVDYYGNPWNYGGTVVIFNLSTIPVSNIGQGTLITDGSGNGNGTFDISYTTQPNDGDSIIIMVNPASGPEGLPPTAVSGIFSEISADTGRMAVDPIRLNSGPNSIELVDFSVSPQSNGTGWLPFALLVGSVALVVGAVFIIRKQRRA